MSADRYGNQLVNQSHIKYDAGSLRYTTYSNTVGIPIVGAIVTLEKETAESQASPGVPVQYAVSVRNAGNLAADVVLYDELPSEMAFVPNSIRRDGVPVPGGSLEEGLPLGSVGAGESVRVVFQLVLAPSAAAENRETVGNRMKADVSFTTSSGRPVKETVYSNTVVLPIAWGEKPVLYAKLSADVSKAAPGDRIRYTLLVGNDGKEPARVQLIDFIPMGTLYVPNSLRVEGQWVRAGVHPEDGYPLGRLAPGESVVVEWYVSVPVVGVESPGQIVANAAGLRGEYADYESGRPAWQPFESNKVFVELWFPVIDAKAKANPKTAVPEETLEFVSVVGNSGNLAASIAADRLVAAPLLLVPGSLRADGAPVPEPGRGEPFRFGELAPSAALRLTFQAIVSPLATTRSIRGHLAFQYAYRLNGRVYSGEASTNPYAVAIVYDDE
ncbi:COG1361 family protein [Paenibacillus arenilitoris]|uniref:DUF11 domain-containing protein n=1 Tax=Paenibacillus arenilitoris TaxID=2772299 RepID=A0A927CJP0_9BACL|nr:DUF11 domain-containing protein [Paenibacillus arenilitoris]MBD2868764.1 DUF11 domain-containing protein [Paenibacillus arenilitoris]